MTLMNERHKIDMYVYTESTINRKICMYFPSMDVLKHFTLAEISIVNNKCLMYLNQGYSSL